MAFGTVSIKYASPAKKDSCAYELPFGDAMSQIGESFQKIAWGATSKFARLPSEISPRNQAPVDRGVSPGNSETDSYIGRIGREDSRTTFEELARLRDENRRLRMERDILKKATAFFVNEKN